MPRLNQAETFIGVLVEMVEDERARQQARRLSGQGYASRFLALLRSEIDSGRPVLDPARHDD